MNVHTHQYGIIGYPLGHSFSRQYFNEKFEREGLLHCNFEAYPLEDIAALPALLASQPDLQGLAVTIPYKQKVLQYVHQQSVEVQQMGAANCICITGGKLTAYNTDITGFEISLLPLLQPHHSQALVLGTGGAAKAVEYVLQKLNIPYQSVSRTAAQGVISYEAVTPALLEAHTLIINCTPLGMEPADDTFPPIHYEALSSRHYLFDLVYKPAETVFLKKGAAMGALVKNGYEMLLIQAEANWKLWNQHV